jgi:hypothetical protein
MKKAWLWFCFVFPLSAVVAPAQIMSNPSQWYINNQIYSTRVFNSAVANSMLGRRGAKTNAARTGGKTNAPRRNPDYTVFRENPKASLAAALAAKTGGADAAEAKKLFDRYIDLYKQTARKDGFPANDLAYAFEYFVVNNYHISRDLLDVPPDRDPFARNARDGFERIEMINRKKLLQVTLAQERAVYQQFRQRLAENPEIQKMTDAQKQEAAELFATLVGVNFSGYLKGVTEGNDALADDARRMATEGLEKLLGVPVSRIRITNDGLEL